MKTIINKYRNATVVLLGYFVLSLFLVGCEDFVEVDEPSGQIYSDSVFEDEESATAAVTSLYGKLRDNVLITGHPYGLTVLMGFYADELDYYGPPGFPVDRFYRHQIIASNDLVKNLWDSSYHLIYMCNSALEGIENSQILTQEVKEHLKGEALFVRSLTHFYLVNLFGAIPYVTTTDYTINQQVSRMETNVVYHHILNDLILAKSYLGEADITGERIRANSYAVSALLARVYLYLEDWEAAEIESSTVINASSLYYFGGQVADEFLKDSPATILQLKPKNEGDNTLEAITFIFISGPPVSKALNPEFVASFEANDQRRANWILEVSDGNEVWYAPYKYKLLENTGTSMEYSIVLRLAEQHLIRAEARAQLGDVNGAKADVNTIRNRVGLLDTSATTPSELLDVILKERRAEFFTEHGHRWFDLKRSFMADDVLSPIKPNWRTTDILLPLPEIEILMNPNLAPQNPGY